MQSTANAFSGLGGHRNKLSSLGEVVNNDQNPMLGDVGFIWLTLCACLTLAGRYFHGAFISRQGLWMGLGSAAPA